MESDAAVANYIGRTARSFRVSGGGTFVDIVGVHSSILCTPTILSSTYVEFTYFPPGSTNLGGPVL